MLDMLWAVGNPTPVGVWLKRKYLPCACCALSHGS